MKTIPLAITAPNHQRPQARARPPVFTTETLTRYARYLTAREGIEHHDFYQRDGLPDMQAARTFAEEMRRQCGAFLDQVITIEQKVNRVFIVLRDEWHQAAAAAVKPY